MKIVLISGYAPSILKFRGDLISSILMRGHVVYAVAPDFDPITQEGVRNIGAIPVVGGFRRCGMNPVDDCVSLFRLYFILKRIHPDLVFSYTVKPVIFGSIAAKLANVNNIYSMITGLGYAFVGDTFIQKIVGKIVVMLYKIAIAVNRVVIFQNSDDQDHFQGLGLLSKSESKVVNGSGVDIKHYAFVKLSVKPFVFLMVARIYKEKGIYEYIAAARIVKNDYPSVKIRLVGSPDSNPNSISESELNGWVDEGLLEWYQHCDDVRPHYREASVYVLPSYREGLPRTVLEAMATGRPIITTDVPGSRETVVQGKNGWLVPCMDPEALALAMVSAIKCEVYLEKMGRASRRMVEDRFNVEHVNQKMLTIMKMN